MEQTILSKLKNYRHPVKTRNLAYLLGINENELIVILNMLLKERKITYLFKRNKQGERMFGWCINEEMDLHASLIHDTSEPIHA